MICAGHEIGSRNLNLLLGIVFTALFCVNVDAKEPIITPPTTPVLGEVDPFLVEALYNVKDADAGLPSLQENARFLELINKHDLKLFGGPMVGSVTESSARIWLRTSRPSTVQVRYREAGKDGPWKSTAEVRTDPATDYTTTIGLQDLSSWTSYTYEVLVNGEVDKVAQRTFKTNPTVQQRVNFSVGFGGGARYIDEKERIWSTIARENPHAFLFLGDNIYIDEPKWRNKQRVMYYRRQLRPEFQELTSQTAAYAIWDDHDFGVNDTSGGPAIDSPSWKIPAWNVFKENWANPAYGFGEEQPGCWFDFSIGDVDFFMTDGRYYRSFKDGTMLGPVQKEWLLKRLKASQAKFKVIASGTLWTEHADKNGRDSWWGVREKRDEIFDFIQNENIPGVILLSADRHRNDIYQIKRPGAYDLYEFETSKLTNDHTHPTKPKALFSYNKGNFYGLLRFQLDKDDPTITCECISIDGELIHSFTLKRSQLEAKQQ